MAVDTCEHVIHYAPPPPLRCPPFHKLISGHPTLVTQKRHVCQHYTVAYYLYNVCVCVCVCVCVRDKG